MENKTKKYKLLKDLPWAEKGTVCEEYGDRMKIPTEDSVDLLGEFGYIRIESVNNFDDWFEEIENNGRWKPKEGERHWYINSALEVSKGEWLEFKIDKKFYEVGNVFRTKSEAKQAAEKVKEALMEFHEEQQNDD